MVGAAEYPDCYGAARLLDWEIVDAAPMPDALRTSLLVAVMLLAACSASDAPAPEPGAVAAHARLEVTADVRDGAEPRVVAHARFLRYREVDADTADVLAGWRSSQLEPGRCELHDPDRRLDDAMALVPTGAEGARTVVSHMDAGELLVTVGGDAAGTMSPRLTPPLAPYVGGVEYDELILDPGPDPALPAGADIGITGFGGEHVGPFDVIATLPPAPERVSVDRADDLTVRWAAARPDSEIGLVVTVQRRGSRPAVSCRTDDDGLLVLFSRVLEQIPGDGPLEVTVERRRRVPLPVPGVQWGELEVAARTVVTAP